MLWLNGCRSSYKIRDPARFSVPLIAQHMTIAEWVRPVLAYARRQEPEGDVEKKIEAIRAAAKHESPTSDIGTMLAEIERGYTAGRP